MGPPCGSRRRSSAGASRARRTLFSHRSRQNRISSATTPSIRRKNPMAATSVDAAVARRAVERPLYVSGAIVAAIVVFAGFAPTYYLKTVFGAPDLDVLRHVHGLVMTTWFTLFFVQAWLASTGRIPLHRQLGAAGIVLAIVVLILGMQLGIASARAGRVPVPGLSPLVFLIFPVGEMVAFAILFGAAIGMRKRAAYHKRFMLLATLAMLNPAFARLPFEFV